MPGKARLDDLRIDRSSARAERGGMGLIWALLLFLLLGAVAGGLWMTRSRAAEVKTWIVRETRPGTQAAAVLNASGNVTPRRQATVSAKVTGKIAEVLIEEGVRVEANQVLARLDDVNVRASLRLAEAQHAAVQAALAETQVRLEEAEREWRRTERLAANEVASTADLDRARAELNLQRARLEKLRSDVAVAESERKIWEQQLEDTIVRAPFAGVVVSKDAQPGEMISPISAGGGFTRTGVCTIVDMNSLEIEVDVNESYINRVRAGQKVTAALDAYPDAEIPAKVITIIPTADRDKSTVRVRVGFEQLDPKILPQMRVKVTFFGEDREEAEGERQLLIPRAAVRQRDGKAWVDLVASGRLERREVTLGAAEKENVTVLSGLQAGEKIVISDSSRLREGAAVEEAKR